MQVSNEPQNCTCSKILEGYRDSSYYFPMNSCFHLSGLSKVLQSKVQRQSTRIPPSFHPAILRRDVFRALTVHVIYLEQKLHTMYSTLHKLPPLLLKRHGCRNLLRYFMSPFRKSSLFLLDNGIRPSSSPTTSDPTPSPTTYTPTSVSLFTHKIDRKPLILSILQIVLSSVHKVSALVTNPFQSFL